MFSVCPRFSDDLNLWQLADELTRPRLDLRIPALLNNTAQSVFSESEVQNTDREFLIRLELPHYKPEEVKITSDNQTITIKAKHEEKKDRHGYVSREMTRVYTLPENVDLKSVTSTMNSRGVLSVTAKKLAIEPPKETAIPIQFTN